jgi:hypothetical protein
MLMAARIWVGGDVVAREGRGRRFLPVSEGDFRVISRGTECQRTQPRLVPNDG